MNWIDKHYIKKLFFILIALFLIFHILLVYALPFEILIPVFIAFIIFYFSIGEINAITVSFSLVIFTLIFELILNISGGDEAVYYRPHEKFVALDSNLKHIPRYKKNINFEMEVPHGDLKALALHVRVTSVPRKVTFKTDSLGFRNNKDYHKQEFVMVGDSFIVGNGTTQNETLTEQLLNEHKVDTYSLAFPGNTTGYLGFIKEFQDKFGEDNKVFLFLFEGNDFNLAKKPLPVVLSNKTGLKHTLASKIDNYRKKITNDIDTYRLIYSLTSRSLHKDEKVVKYRISETMSMAFFRSYNSIAKQDSQQENQEFENNIQLLKDKIMHIFFIPTKYRVYYKNIAQFNSNKLPVELPNRQWEFTQKMANKYNIGVTDLTPALIKKSEQLLQDEKVTFWPDDTHWNKNGISVAAKIVAEKINKYK